MLRDKLVSNEVWETNLRNYIQQIESIKKIIIWGTSDSGQIVYNFLKEMNLNHKVIGFADNDKNKWGEVLNSLRILSPNEVIERNKIEDQLYIINAVHIQEIEDQLLLLGINKDKIDMRCYHIAQAYLTNQREIIYTHIDDCEKVYMMLEDNRSKEIYLAKLNYKLSGDNKYLENLVDNNSQYFDKEILELIEDEVFVDCGSFNGDTLEKFYKVSQGKYKKYIALELDQGIYQELTHKVKEKGYLNIETFNRACWYEEAKLKFQSHSHASHLTEDGSTIVQADSLDHLLGDRPVTFIKMDIEGAEENALKGAEKLIREHTPILAICIYHKVEDYYKLPFLIKKFNEKYRLFIRHYLDKQDIETVCYAIPKERLIK